MQSIENCIQRQIDINRSKNLLHAQAKHFMDIEPGFRSTLEELLTLSSSDKAEHLPPKLVQFAARTLLKRLFSVNQFLRIDRQKLAELECIYRHTWDTMRQTGNIQVTLRELHYPQLSQWLASLYPIDFLEPIRSLPIVGHVVCEEYSAQLQVALFQIDISRIHQPLIDVGCGSRAILVRYLRSLGVEAYGFDRLLEVQEPYLEQKDWFDYAFERSRWGSVTSNMGFTNHLLYTYHQDRSQFVSYLLKMKDILGSLVIGGSFYYAPGVPFIEDRLAPTHYHVERRRVIEDIFVSVVTKVGN